MVYAWLSRQRVNQHDSSNDDSDNNSVSNGINNNNNSNFNDIRAFMPNVLLINVTKLKRFFDKNKSQYNIVPTKGTRSRYEQWITYNIFIPLEDCRECYKVIKIR